MFLITCACACRYKTHNFSDPSDNDNWLLLPYQQRPGQAGSFVQHIKLGVQVQHPPVPRLGTRT